MRRQRRSLKLLALIMGLSLLAGACGSGDDDEGAEEGGEEAANPPSGCRFRTRCWRKRELEAAGIDTSACVEQEPALEARPADGVEHPVACHFAKPQAVI